MRLTDLKQKIETRRKRDFFAREKLAYAIYRTLAEGRHIALLAEDGIGKTALFLQAAAIALDERRLRNGQKRLSFLELETSEIRDIKTDMSGLQNAVIYIPDAQSLEPEIIEDLYAKAKEAGGVLAAESTPAAWAKFAETSPSLAELFYVIEVKEPSFGELYNILRDDAQRLDEELYLQLSEPLAKRIARDADIVYGSLKEPKKSLSLLRNAQNYKNEKEFVKENEPLSPKFIDKVASIYSGLPIYFFDADDLPPFEEFYALLSSKVAAQDDAARKAAEMIYEALLKEEPEEDEEGSKGAFVSAFLFGRKGVGRTALARAAAEAYYGGKDRFFRVDFRLLEENGGRARLFGEGKNPGEIGQILLMEPSCVVCFDNAARADEFAAEILTQALETGVYVNAAGRRFSMGKSAFFFSLDAPDKQDGHSFTEADVIEALGGAACVKLMKAAGGTIFFKDLSPSDLNALAESFVNRVSSMEEVSKRNLSIEVDRKLLEDIAKSGEGSAVGAKTVQKAVEESVVLPITLAISSGKIDGGQKVKIESKEGKPLLRVIEGSAKPLKPRMSTVEIKIRRVTDSGLERNELKSSLARKEYYETKLAELRGLYPNAPLRLAAADSDPDEPADFDGLLRMHIDQMKRHFQEIYDELEAGLAEGLGSSDSRNACVELLKKFYSFEKSFDRLETAALYFDRFDYQDALVTIKTHSGEGAFDWARMLVEMYRGWAKRNGRLAEIVNESSSCCEGEESISIIIKGAYSFGCLKLEQGLHRLSSDSSGARERVCKTFVYPYISDNVFVKTTNMAFVKYVAVEAVKGTSAFGGPLRSRVTAENGASRDCVCLCNANKLGENKALARKILNGIETWRKSGAGVSSQVALIRNYDAADDAIKDQIDCPLTFTAGMEGRIDELLTARIKALAKPKKPFLPPIMG